MQRTDLKVGNSLEGIATDVGDLGTMKMIQVCPRGQVEIQGIFGFSSVLALVLVSGWSVVVISIYPSLPKPK